MPKVFRTFRKSIAKQLNAAAQEIIYILWDGPIIGSFVLLWRFESKAHYNQ
jgi:hypothetical protein